MTKYLAKLIYLLVKNGSIKAALDINDILEKIMESDDAAANIVGLQESEIYQNMNQGYDLEPFFDTSTNLE